MAERELRAQSFSPGPAAAPQAERLVDEIMKMQSGWDSLFQEGADRGFLSSQRGWGEALPNGWCKLGAKSLFRNDAE